MSTSDQGITAFKMFGQLQSKDNDDKLKQIQQTNTQKALLDQQVANQNFFFALLIRLFEEKLQQDALKERLLLAAEQYGFSNIREALNLARNPDGQSPLQHAFQKQNFELAQKLMDYGAIPGPIERAVFEVALDSKGAKEFGFTPQYIKGEEKLHPVKNYGLVLGIAMTSKDGTYSQFGHVGPTYQLMTEAVNKYAKGNDNFKKIAEAYDFSNKAIKFSQSTSQRNPEAGKEIANRIQQGEITTIPISFSGHAMGLSVVPDGPNSKSGYLVVTNRGLGAKRGEEGTQIYRVEDLSKINEQFINTVVNGHSNDLSQDKIMKEIERVTNYSPPVHTIKQKSQKNDNCSIANTRSNIHGILLCQKAKEKGVLVQELSSNDRDSVKSEFKKFTNDMRMDKVNDLVKAIQKDPDDIDLKNLAKEYLKGHPRAGQHLREPLEKVLGVNSNQETQKSLGKQF